MYEVTFGLFALQLHDWSIVFVIFVFVGVALKYASLIRMHFGPHGHASRPYASMAEWLVIGLRIRWPRFDSWWTHIELFSFIPFFSS